MHKASDISYRLILEVTISEITSEALNSSLSHISWHLTDIYFFLFVCFLVHVHHMLCYECNQFVSSCHTMVYKPTATHSS